MNLYKSEQTITLHSGKVALTKDQARRRAAAVVPTDEEGVYDIVRPVQFKAGEEFGHDAHLPKHLMGMVEVVEAMAEAPEPVGEDTTAGGKKGRAKA